MDIGENDGAMLNAFREVAHAVYEGDTVWASASESVFERNWVRRSAHPNKVFQPIVALDSAQPVARAVAILKDGATGDNGAPQGYIGFFECVEDRADAARLILQRCGEILKDAGAESLLAQKVDNQLFGCQVSGFDLPHVCLTAYNPPYYLDLFESAGFRVREHVLSMYFTRETAGLAAVTIPGFTTRAFDRTRLGEEIALFHQLQPEIFGDRSGYVPRTLAEDREMIESLLPIFDDDMIIIAEDSDGRPAGILVCLPDFYQAISGNCVDRARVVSIGVRTDCAGRGLGTLMGAHLFRTLLRKPQYLFAEASVVLAKNIAPQNLAKRFHAKPGRTFVLLEKNL